MKTAHEDSPGITTLFLLLPGLLLGLFGSCAPGRTSTSLQERLQGTWEGFELSRATPTEPYVRSDPTGTIRITIAGNTLHFYKDPEFWFETTFTLPVDTDPPQLHATIERPEESKGEVVVALLRFDDETLTLGGVRDGDSTAAWPQTFEASEDTMTGRYELRRVGP